MSDILRTDFINSLSQPLYAETSKGCWWPVWDIEPQCAIMRIDVCGLLEVRDFTDARKIKDSDGNGYDTDVFFIDYEESPQ